jgi:predicted esterase
MTFQELTDEMTDLYAQGRYANALELVEQHAHSFPEHVARTTFWKICLLSLCGRAEEVISVFQRGLDSGLWWADRQFTDTDLNAVRDLPKFKRLMDISIERYREAQKHIKPERVLLEPDTYDSTIPLLIALHGGGGNKEWNLKEWDIARRRGWLVLLPQSTHSIFPNGYWWADDLEQRLRDIQVHLEEILQSYPVDRTQIVTAGMSQGSGMAICTALSGKFPVRGFISIAIGWQDTSIIADLARHSHIQGVRGYFVTGEKDQFLPSARDIQKILLDNNVPFDEEVYPDLGHEWPPDLEKSFDSAIAFIFKE